MVDLVHPDVFGQVVGSGEALVAYFAQIGFDAVVGPQMSGQFV